MTNRVGNIEQKTESMDSKNIHKCCFYKNQNLINKNVSHRSSYETVIIDFSHGFCAIRVRPTLGSE